ncbi:hypothetical protein TNCV_290551 [Trichonephila clavipes]|nr:hypothetical protein TNCV_290551 [Trichonephila clavipes]
MSRWIKIKALDHSEAVEDSFGNFSTFIREYQIFWIFWVDVEKPVLICCAAEDMLWRQLNITAVWAMICVTSLSSVENSL